MADRTLTGKIGPNGPYTDSNLAVEAMCGKDPGKGERIQPLTGPILPFGQFPRPEAPPNWTTLSSFGKG